MQKPLTKTPVSPPQLVELPPNQQPSYRITGGTDTLIQALADRLNESRIHLNRAVQSIRKTGATLVLQTERDLYTANVVISTLPPRLLVGCTNFSPSLLDELAGIASRLHTGWRKRSKSR